MIQVDDAEGRICAVLPAKSILPPWALHGWQHEHGCVCENCEGEIHGDD